MGTRTVIKGLDVIEDLGFGEGTSWEGGAVNEFKFEGAPEAFHRGIVVTVGLAAHGRNQARMGEGLAVVCAGVLDPSVGVTNQIGWWVSVGNGHGEGF